MPNTSITYQYQPIVSLRNLEVERYEALLRGRGMPDTIALIRHLQSMDKGVELDIYTLKTVLSEWHALAITARMPIAVNISPNSLENSYFREESLSIIRSFGQPQLSIELTEDAPISNVPHVHAYLRSIRDMGITVGLDDLGDGYSSLDQVGDFNLDYIKLSHTLTTKLLSSVDVKREVENVIEYAKSRGISMVAEHIDDTQQFRWLRDAGVSHGQGWLFARAGGIISDIPAFEKRLRQLLMS